VKKRQREIEGNGKIDSEGGWEERYIGREDR
jgi:hypothetical protein